MCGLAGFARHPESPSLETAKRIVSTLLLEQKHRGRHATGVAASGGSNPFVWKWAVDPTTAVGSEAWTNVMEAVAPNTPFLMGHIRWATQNNANKDEAAHPFQIGKVVGAHNGIIRNWDELRSKTDDGKEWIVDSQAALSLLNKFKDPAKALNLLDGYWSLTWTKNGKLFACRTHDAPLALAYVPAERTLYWASERDILRRTLLRHYQVKDFDLWENSPGVLYEYDVGKFDKLGCNPTKKDVAFKSRTNGRVDPRTMGRVAWDDSKSSTKGKSKPPIQLPARTQSESSTDPFAVASEALARTVRALVRRVAELESKVESMAGELEHLFAVVDDAGLLDVESTNAEDGAEYDPKQIDWTQELAVPTPHLVCVECGGTEDDGELVETPHGEPIHTHCIFAADDARLRVGL